MKMADVKGLELVLEEGKNGFMLNGNPVEFRYFHDEDKRLVACVAATMQEDCLMMGTARIHPMDMGKGSKIRGRYIATKRLECALDNCSNVPTQYLEFIAERDNTWKPVLDYQNEKEKNFWSSFLTDDFLNAMRERLQKRIS